MTLIDHLWQSTLCAGVAALIALALHRAPARTRHIVWLLASLKFLVPFSALVAVGRYAGEVVPSLVPGGASAGSAGLAGLGLMGWLAASLPVATFTTVVQPIDGGVEMLANRGAVSTLIAIWAIGTAILIAWRWRQWTRVSHLAATAAPLTNGRERETLERVPRQSPNAPPIQLVQIDSGLEPGVVGIVRPRLLWPAGLSARLSDRELDAILSHEACHVDRRDNAAALLHVVVESVFWFHPVVWWIGARLVSERERACDEAVVRMGTDRQSYAEGILKVCGFCLRGPAAVMAGVAGGNLAGRIELILRRPASAPLTFAARVLLGAVVAATATMPLAAGVLSAPRTVAAQEQGSRKIYRPGKDVKAPKLVKETKPNYTREAMEARIQGNLKLTAVVLEDGSVDDVQVVESLDKEYGLDDEAVRTLHDWVFEPGTKDGKPVAVLIDVEMTFRLK